VQPVTLEQLIALNREICALAAAGLPLEQGLVRVSKDLSGPSGKLALRLAERMDQGANLDAAIDAESNALPKSYRVLVHAGLRSGNLASALEGYSETASRLAELRRMVGLASLYPIFLALAAWIFFLFATSVVIPNFDWLDINEHFWGHRLQFLRLGFDTPGRWIFATFVPVVILILVFVWWRRSAQAVEASVAGQASWIPGISRIRSLSCEANFSDLLRLFVVNQLPLPEALPLAAEASGLSSVSTAAHELAKDLIAGKSLTNNSENFRRLPAQIRLALLSTHGPQGVVDGLRRASENYRQRAVNWAHTISLYLPMAFTALLGGTTVGVYAFLIFQPYVATLKELSQWQ